MYYIKCDSAHTGKGSVLINDVPNEHIKALLTYDIGIEEIRIDLGDEIYHYGCFYDEIKENLISKWNLFNSQEMELQYNNILVEEYNVK